MSDYGSENSITLHVSELDVFMLTMDEPNADMHWGKLLDQCPYAQRIHGVKGFDAAHHAAAEQSSTDWFVTVDADNVVMPAFFDHMVTLRHARHCLSFNGLNMVNGLQYGNGGLKIWSKQFVADMKTHENADDPRRAVDFCWEDDYQQVQLTFSEVWSNGSPYQAFRAGFREGVKLSLDRGQRVRARDMARRLNVHNMRNLRVWCCVGRDRPNGIWAMYGARAGWLKMCEPDYEHRLASDFDYFRRLWDDVSAQDPEQAALDAGQTLRHLTGVDLPLLADNASTFFRVCLIRP